MPILHPFNPQWQVNIVMLRLLEYKCQEVDHQLAIAKDLDRIPEGWLIPEKLGQTLQGVL